MSVSQKGNTMLTINKVALHTLYSGRKLIKGIGELELVENDGALWIRVNHWHHQQVLKSSEFYKVVYDHFFTYIFENIAGGFYAISIDKNDPNITNFQDKINVITKIIDLKTGLNDEEFKKKMEYHYPDIQNNPIHNEDLFTPFFNFGGKVQNSIGKTVQPSLTNQSMRTKAKNYFKSGWESLKAGFRKVDQKTNQIPGVKATKDFVGNTASKIKQTTINAVEKVTHRNKQETQPLVN